MNANKRSLAKEITEGFKALETMRNNEPVAWTDGKGNYFDKNNFFPVDDLIPLYTHPVKELTDAEIRTIQDMCHLKNVGYNTFIMRFARAILRKAQEK